MLTRLDIYLDVVMYHNIPRYFSEIGILTQKILIPYFLLCNRWLMLASVIIM